MLDTEIEPADDMKLGVCVELKMEREVDAGFNVELGMAFVEPDTDSEIWPEVIVAPAFAEVAFPIEASTLVVDARFIDEPMPRLGTAPLPEEFGTQHSARLERRDNNKICGAYFRTLANWAPSRNEETPITAVRSADTYALAVRRATCPVTDTSGALRGCTWTGSKTSTSIGASRIGDATLRKVRETR